MIKVSIVEDTDEIRATLIETVQEVSDMVFVDAYDNAEAALGGLQLNKPDVVIMDIGLPGMSGIECMMRLKSVNDDIKFMMFTVFENDEHVFEALKIGADGYILKRESPDNILQYIREINVGGAPMSRVIAKKVLNSFRETPKDKLIEELTPRQLEILELLSKGNSYNAIASQLGLSEGTIKQHCHNTYKKLHVNNKTQAINKYVNG